MNVILYGPPGAGKGTVAEKIEGELGVPHISSGDIIRQMSKEQSEIGKKVQDVLLKGDLIQDSMMIEIMALP